MSKNNANKCIVLCFAELKVNTPRGFRGDFLLLTYWQISNHIRHGSVYPIDKLCCSFVLLKTTLLLYILSRHTESCRIPVSLSLNTHLCLSPSTVIETRLFFIKLKLGKNQFLNSLQFAILLDRWSCRAECVTITDWTLSF